MTNFKHILAAAAAGGAIMLVVGVVVMLTDDTVSESDSDHQATSHGFQRMAGVAPVTRGDDTGVRVDMPGHKCTFVFFGSPQEQDSSTSRLVVTEVNTGEELTVIFNPQRSSVFSDFTVATHC